ncbi:hypothetical protein [uncultured Lamprocystis sp.]|uniref:hypothetical protein n=1 Tax=uncultured Lamprocystis sp. TaxID=543132 RepID=UPI0025ED0A40|nr:hypothetical protein [uncultured Lamprocystis sp.]
MPPRRFYAANVASAVAQTLVFFLPGMVLGASLKLAAEAAWWLIILGVLLFGALTLAFWLAHRVYRLLAPHASAWFQGLLRWSNLYPTIARLAHVLANPEHPDARALTGLAFLLMLSALLVGAITGLTLFGSPELALDRAALDLGQSLREPSVDGPACRPGDVRYRPAHNAPGLLGMVWVAALGLAFHRHARLRLRAEVLAGVAAVGLLIGLGLHGWIAADRDLVRLTPAERTAWHDGAWARLPHHREDLSQHNRHPLTIQYAGDPAALAATLATAGWGPRWCSIGRTRCGSCHRHCHSRDCR